MCLNVFVFQMPCLVSVPQSKRAARGNLVSIETSNIDQSEQQTTKNNKAENKLTTSHFKVSPDKEAVFSTQYVFYSVRFLLSVISTHSVES